MAIDPWVTGAGKQDSSGKEQKDKEGALKKNKRRGSSIRLLCRKISSFPSIRRAAETS